ncbi:hypothetical protein [Acetobacter vaccinii]|uniref:Uncharacterized protein n=1 Tax=Acetobacter vaccinii TaxID=2592655 RepID=A0A5C1YME3_9PROT|nr:hypothetical protein [Acetobacter vaccinii]QEO16389.1 hypothetical protein FLP30_00330 [Acetobacter vaccinii]
MPRTPGNAVADRPLCVYNTGAMTIFFPRWPALAGLCLLLFSASPLHAEQHLCTWVWNCTNKACRHVPQCLNSYDVIPPEPLELPPVAPLDAGSSPAANLPPAGRHTCVPRHICTSYGVCEWQTRC